MDAEHPPAQLLVFTTDNSVVHLYPNVAELLASQGVGGGKDDVPVEIFDSLGFRLAPSFGLGWHMTNLTRTAEKPDPDQVACRLAEAVRQMAERIVKFPEQICEAGLTPEEVLAHLPSLDGLSLDVAVQQITFPLGHTRGSVGDQLHNFVVHAIW